MSNSDFDTDRLFDPADLQLDAGAHGLTSDWPELVFELPVSSHFEESTLMDSIKQEIVENPLKIIAEEKPINDELKVLLAKESNQPGYDFEELTFEKIENNTYDSLSKESLFDDKEDIYSIERIENDSASVNSISLDFLNPTTLKNENSDNIIPLAPPSLIENVFTGPRPKLSGLAASALIAAGYAATAFASMFGSVKKTDHAMLTKTPNHTAPVFAPEIPGTGSINHNTAESSLELPPNPNAGLESEPTDITSLTSISNLSEYFQYIDAALPQHKEVLTALMNEIQDANNNGNFSDLMTLKEEINQVDALVRNGAEIKPLEIIKDTLKKACRTAIHKLEYKIVEAQTPKYPTINKASYDSDLDNLKHDLIENTNGVLSSSVFGSSLNSFMNQVLSEKYNIVPLSYSKGIISNSAQLEEALLDTFRRNNQPRLTELYQSYKQINDFYSKMKEFVKNSNLTQASKEILSNKIEKINGRLDSMQDIFVGVTKRAWFEGNILGTREAHVIHHHESFPSSGETLKRDSSLQDHVLYELNRHEEGFSYRELVDPTPSEAYRYIDKLDHELQALETAGLLKEDSKRALYIWNHGATAKNGDHIIDMKEETLPAGENRLYGYGKPNPNYSTQLAFNQADITSKRLSLKLLTNKINKLLEKHPKVKEFDLHIMTCRNKIDYIHNSIPKEQLNKRLNLVFFTLEGEKHSSQWVPGVKNHGISEAAIAMYLNKLTKESPQSIDGFVSSNTEELRNVLAIDKGLNRNLAVNGSSDNNFYKNYEVKSNGANEIIGYQGSRFAELLQKLDRLVEKAREELKKDKL